MPRVVTGPEAALLAGGNYHVYHRTWIKNGSGTFINLSSLAGGIDFVQQVELDRDIDEPIAAATIRVKRDIGALSLAALRTDSTLNRLDDGATYGALVDVGRSIFTETAVVARGSSPISSDWKQMFSGLTDTVTDGNTDTKTLEIACRGLGAVIADAWAAPNARTYTDLVGGGKPIQDVVQEILDLYVTDAGGSRVITLVTPVDPAYLVTSFSWGVEAVTDVLSRLIQVIGGDLRYLWNDSLSQWQYSLTIPNRAKVTPDATIGPSQYISVNRLAIDRTTVRNEIRVEYGPATQGGIPRAAVVGSDGTSQLRYGKRTVVDSEASDSPIDTADEATRLIGLILSDVKDPKAEQQIEMLYYWPVEIWDLNRWSANGVHYNTDQDLAVVHVKHTLGASGGTQHRTTVDVRGKPAGAYLTWFGRFLSSFGQPQPSTSANSILRITEKESTDGTTASVVLIVGALVDHVQAYYRTVPIDQVGDVNDFSDTATLPVDGTLVARPDASGALTFAFPQPPRGKKLIARFVPLYFGGTSYVAGESVVFPVNAAPPAINVQLHATRAGNLASVSGTAAVGISDVPGSLVIIETVLGVDSTILTVNPVTGNMVLDPAVTTALANRTIAAGVEKVTWRAEYTDVSGQVWKFSDVTALPALVNGTVAVSENAAARQATITATLTDSGHYLNPSATDPLDVTKVGALTAHLTLKGVTTAMAPTTIPVSGTSGDYTFVITLDPTRPIAVTIYRHYVDGSTDVLWDNALDSNKISDVVNASAVNNGTTANVPVQFDNDTKVGAGCARYSLDSGSTWTPGAVASDFSALFIGIARTTSVQSMILQGQNAIDSAWGNQTTIQINPFTIDVPSLTAQYKPLTSSTGQVIWSCAVGSPTLSIDGGTPATPSASPIAITLDGSTHNYAFVATIGSQTIPVSVTVPALPTAGGASGSYSSLTNVLNDATTNKVDFGWAWSGPTASFNVYVSDPLRYGGSTAYVLDGTTASGASSYTYTTTDDLTTNHADPTTPIAFYVEAVVGSTVGVRSVPLSAPYNHV